MKKLVLIVAMATTLMSCNRYVNVKLTNGAIVKCLNESRIDFPEYTQVCVHNNRSMWYVCEDGEMRDTVINRKSGAVKHRLGKITKLY